jgi:hypothetical protein
LWFIHAFFFDICILFSDFPERLTSLSGVQQVTYSLLRFIKAKQQEKDMCPSDPRTQPNIPMLVLSEATPGYSLLQLSTGTGVEGVCPRKSV